MYSRIKNLPRALRGLLVVNIFVIFMALVLPTTVYADDCLRDPLNAADCMRTRGYRQTLVIIFSTLPTLSVIIPNLLQAPSNVLPPILQSGGQIPMQPPEQIFEPPHQPEPPPNLINEKGQVWYQPPWDQGGAYWVDRDEYDNIQRHLQQGYVWSDTYGWKPPQELNQLNRQREENWRKFTSREEGLRRHDQLMRNIQRDLQNDPEYQRIQRELADLKARLDEMKRQSIQSDMAYYQKQSKRYEALAERYDFLYERAKEVKWVADQTINTVGMAPGAGRYVKYTYTFASNAAGKAAETGSLVEGAKSGLVETTKAYVGDKIGDNLPIPGVKDATDWGPMNVKTFTKELIKHNKTQMVLNKAKDMGVSEGVNQAEHLIHTVMQ